MELREWTIHDAEDLRGVSPLHRKAAHERTYEWSITLHGDQPSLRRIDAGQPQLKQLDIKPQFDFKNVISRLQDPEIDEHAAIALVRGIHEKFWHATVEDLALLLHRAQLPRPIVALAKIVVATCKECRPYARPINKPTLRAELAGYFNDQVQCDLFFLWGKTQCLLVDEGTRYKISGELESKHGHHICRFILRDWARYFGPMRVLIMEQEGGIRSSKSGECLENLGITRRLKCSQVQGEHTGTGRSSCPTDQAFFYETQGFSAEDRTLHRR